MIIGIIPARFASTRLMGKPLADIGGKPMLQHAYESAKKSRLLQDVVIAVDDEKVAQIARNFGARVFVTPKNVATGTDRIAIVAKELTSAHIIVNIQGDEPFIKGRMIDQAIEPLLFDPTVNVSTLAKKIETVEDLKAVSIPKVVFDYNNFAMYFSRSPIPFVRNARTHLERLQKCEIYKHIGLYVYTRESLLNFTKLPQTDLELAEQLEQLRMLENGFRIKVVVTEYENLAVDTPDDLERARYYYKQILKNPDYDGNEPD
ncbi:MAG: 3-deoxy-manno-octulosonate cytidylyltransferase [Ignavibacteriaceae bacterium]|nr:3-deoxy-manno-octulosonate cytidylyltransferase [Ignavibacteriaceae bacterium]